MAETAAFARQPRAWALSVSTSRWAQWAPFVAVVGLSLFMNAWGLSKSGYGNTYYAAAVRSMTGSWHNFFFGAFDPGGFITVDKPPVFLWVDAASARLFGYSSWSLLLPSAVAGATAVGLLWLTMRRYFGVTAATVAALVLALTPIAVAVNRLNLPEPFYVLALVGAAACILRSLDGGRWWTWTAAAGLLVGVAFNTKMLAGWIPGPALALAIVAGVEGTLLTSWRRWLPRLAVLGIVTLAASGSWMLIVDAWPSSDRPYVGGSTDNTVSDLILGYNGLDRVEGEFGGGGGPPGGFGRFGGGPGGGGANANPFNGPGGIFGGDPDPLRMFDAANGGQIAWFLPFALIGGALSLWHWRSQRLLRAAVVLWLGWVLLFGGVFSYSQGIYHSYYTSALAPGVAALTGMSVLAIGQMTARHPGWLAAGAAMALATLWVQLEVSGRFEGFFDELRPFMVLAVLAGLAVWAASVWQRRLPMHLGLAVVLGGLLLMPAAWSGYETVHASLNTTLPQAGPRGGTSGFSFGSQAFDNGTAQLAAWLETHDDAAARWDLVVTSAMNASTLIADYDLSVMPLGGFSGRDPTLTASGFAELVASGEARYVLASGAFGGGFGGPAFDGQPFGRGFGGQNDGLGNRFGRNRFSGPFGSNNGPGTPFGTPGGNNGFGGGNFGTPSQSSVPDAGEQAGADAVLAAVRTACQAVTDPSLPAQYRGQLYDCAGAASQLAR
jgi:4-amino-4-deoxy-L-arabinose transferase-like glycosyltransferase